MSIYSVILPAQPKKRTSAAITALKNTRREKRRGRNRLCKPGSVVNNHLSRTHVAVRLMPPRWAAEQTLTPGGVLLRIGFTWLRRLRRTGELLPRLSILACLREYPKMQAVYFCCTCPGVASGGCYPLSCSVKPGLSSRQDLSVCCRAIAQNGCKQYYHRKYILSNGCIKNKTDI